MTTERDAYALDPARFDCLVPSRLFSLEGKVAVVTGAAGGIGAWLSAGLARAGATILLTDRAGRVPPRLCPGRCKGAG